MSCNASYARMPPQSDARIQTAALPPDQELQRELQCELHRMPQPAVPEDLACAEQLAEIARYTPQPNRAGPAECGAVDLVRLDRIVMPDKVRVSLQPPPLLRCSMAQAVAEWIRDDLGPAAAKLGAPLASIMENDSYDCRSRNNVKGAKLSEHARGNALDINAIRLGNGGIFKLSDRLVSQPFRQRVRDTACGRFTTVLGPGSDAYHAEHIALDLAERSARGRICQWDLRDRVATPPREPKGPASRARDANAKALLKAKTKTAPTRAPAPLDSDPAQWNLLAPQTSSPLP